MRDALLSAYGWSFATGQVALNRLDTPPAADYANAFQLPDDFLRQRFDVQRDVGQFRHTSILRWRGSCKPTAEGVSLTSEDL